MINPVTNMFMILASQHIRNEYGPTNYRLYPSTANNIRRKPCKPFANFFFIGLNIWVEKFYLPIISFILQDITNSLHKPHMKRRHKRKLCGPQHLAAHAKQGYGQTYQVKNNTTQQSQIEDNPDLWYLNPRFNFTDALADINKRLLSQTSFWIRL